MNRLKNWFYSEAGDTSLYRLSVTGRRLERMRGCNQAAPAAKGSSAVGEPVEPSTKHIKGTSFHFSPILEILAF